MKSRYAFTITEDYLHAYRFPFGSTERRRAVKLHQTIGRVQPCDIGKWVYEVTSPSGYVFYQVENQQQLEVRLAK